MSFTRFTADFTNGSTSVTNVVLEKGTLSYFGRGTRLAVGKNPVAAIVEAIAAPTATTVTLGEPWPLATGNYSVEATQTSEGIYNLTNALRDSTAQLNTVLDSVDVNPTADSLVKRTSTGAARVADAQNADEAVAKGQLSAVATTGDFDDLTDIAKVYQKNNILGTVSQSGGLPTGAIIERGSNANGEYVKVADGTLICSATVDFATELNTPWGALYTSIRKTWNFPVAFAARPAISGLGVEWDDMFVIYGGDDIANGLQISLRLCSAVSYTNATLLSTRVGAVGRWY